jgi:hypothetical protein
VRERRFSEIRETLFIHSLHTTILFSLQNLSLSLSLLSQHTNLHIHRQTNKQTNKYICIYIYRYTHTYSMTDMRRQRETGTEKQYTNAKECILHIKYALLSSKGLLLSKLNPPHHSTIQSPNTTSSQKEARDGCVKKRMREGYGNHLPILLKVSADSLMASALRSMEI